MPPIIQFVVGLVVFLFLFFAFFLFFLQKGNRLSKSLLGLFFLSLGFAVADMYLLISKSYFTNPQYAFILNSLPLVYGPLLWLFTKSVVKNSYKLKTADLLHFFPYGLVIVSSIFFYHIHNLDYKREFLRRSTDDPGIAPMVFSFLIFISIGVYIFFSHREILLYRKQIKEEVSNIDAINLGWLNFTILGFGTIMLISFLIQVAASISPWDDILNTLLIILLMVMFLFIMGAIVRGLQSDAKFASSLEKVEIKNRVQVDREKLNPLEKLMDFKQPFLNPSLSLGELAEELKITPKELSILINQGFGHSFFDFVNRYRVSYAQEKIHKSEDDKLTILEVMYSSGFNSKSSFNTAFKKHSGMTPTQWKKLKH